jgi:spore coat protein U-like protein
MNRHFAYIVFIVLAVVPWAGVSAQTTASTTFRVTAKVQAVCAITASDLAFGNYSAQSGTPLTGTTLLQATCTPSSSYNIGLDAGTSPGATVNQRKMVAGANILNYQLYSDSSRTTIWGNTSGTDTVTGTGTGLAVDHTVYGTIPAAQVVPAGDYADTITVRIFY